MKRRKGFISNSSSSSFVVLLKDKELTEEQLLNENKEQYAEHQGIDPTTMDKYYAKKCEGYAKNGNKILFIESIEYGAEEGVQNLTNAIVRKLVPDAEVSFEWEE